MEAEEVKALSAPGEADDAGLLRMQQHPHFAQHLRRQLPGLFGALSGRRQDHKIIGSHARISLSIGRSETRLAIWAISAS
jgi:hypothetical protein